MSICKLQLVPVWVVAIAGLIAGLSGCTKPAEDTARGQAGVAVQAGPADWVKKYEFPEPGSILATGCDSSTVVVRELDDPDNPYRDRYTELDYWCYSNAKPGDSELLDPFAGEPPEHFQRMNAVVDFDGFIVPQIEIYRMNIIKEHLPAGESLADHHVPGLDLTRILLHGDSCARSFPAVGILDPAVSSAFEQQVCDVLATFIPPVPEWLAAAPPRLVLLMTDGEVVTYGELGSNRDELLVAAEATKQAESPWVRFDTAGRELARVEPGHDWFEVYFADYTVVAAEVLEQNLRLYESNGIVAAINEAGEISAAYDYRGNPLDPSQEELWPGKPPYEEIPGKFMPWLFAAQQKTAGSTGG